MKKRLISFVAAMALLMSAPFTVHAEEFSGGDGWSVTFDGKKMNSTFKSTDIDDAIYQLQPGDSIKIHLALENAHDEATNWYMSNEVLQSLEDSKSTAEGGAYSYILTYINPQGNQETLYSSEAVGGETVNKSGEGLHQATDSLKDFFYLDQLEAGAKGEVMLTVKLEGETQGNSYQDTLAKLQMNFAVELTGSSSSGLPTLQKFVKTGDDTNILIFSLIALIGGMICVVAVVLRIRGERSNPQRVEKKKEDRRAQ
ncbi:MAG: hypothetical protein ACI4ES_14515 [Roseburia sp.]